MFVERFDLCNEIPQEDTRLADHLDKPFRPDWGGLATIGGLLLLFLL